MMPSFSDKFFQIDLTFSMKNCYSSVAEFMHDGRGNVGRCL